jgi:hypothetical protein
MDIEILTVVPPRPLLAQFPPGTIGGHFTDYWMAIQ